MPNVTAWAGADTSTQDAVHLGTWVNWSRGSIMGATLTITRTNGNYLLSFTAFFISFVSVRFWQILCSLVHYHLSTPETRDALHHQRQVVLRNSDSATTGLWRTLQLARAWRRTADNLLSRTLPVIAMAVLCVTAFTIAGGFSSQISTGISNEVLLDGSHCGITYTQSFSPTSGVVGMYIANEAMSAANYAQQCYSANASHTFACTSLVKPRLTGTVDFDAPCPFSGGLCRSNTSNIKLDTGYIDSGEHLGINAPPGEKILFRSILQCAPLVTDGFSESNASHTKYYYGQKIQFPENYTYTSPNLASQRYNGSDPFTDRGRNFVLS